MIFEGTVVSNVGPPVPGVGKSCKKSVKKRFDAHSKEPEKKKENININKKSTKYLKFTKTNVIYLFRIYLKFI